MYKFSKGSVFFDIKTPEYHKQDLGVSPKGTSDRLSFFIAHTLLGKPKEFKASEVLYTKETVFENECIFCISGARYKRLLLNDKEIKHNCVKKAKKGDRLVFDKKVKGFRSYILAASINEKRVGLHMDSFENYFTTYSDVIRVVKGVEYEYMEDASKVLDKPFKISQNSSLMGLRLEDSFIKAKRYDIVSSVVSDGTVQLTKDGMIVLMRHRQTTGGYPRILQVISTDIDRLAQYAVGSLVRFELVSMQEARVALKQRELELKKFKKVFDGDKKSEDTSYI
jgi:allophanate hydrolase subunit 2